MTKTAVASLDPDLYVVGIDPGPVVGILGLVIEPGAPVHPESPWLIDAAQCSDHTVMSVLNGLCEPLAAHHVVIAAERFVVGPRAGRSNAPGAGKAARTTLARVAQWARARGCRYIERSAAEVKPWATDTRLAAAALLEPTKGMRHARDAARHALFAAVKDCGVVDPLSRKAAR